MSTNVLAPSRPVVARKSGAALPALVGLEIRKSLSTRSGICLATGAALLAPALSIVGGTTAQPVTRAIEVVSFLGLLTAYLLFSLGVLSAAGEWTNGSVQTTYLLVPRRSRVLVAKAVGVAVMGAALTAVAVAMASGVLFLLEPSTMSWSGIWPCIATVVGAGAAFAVVGAGVGAALGNTAAALTGLYLTVLGVMPLLETLKPAIAHAIDPANAVLNLARGHNGTTSAVILAGWVVVTVVAGAVLTNRRAVQ